MGGEAAVLDSIRPVELSRQHTGSTVVWLTAVGYPAPRMAVLAFWSGGRGVARLVRQADGQWKVAAHVTHPVD